MPSSPFILEASIIDLLGQGVALVVGTANEAREPEICRAWGPLWSPEGGTLEILLPLPAAESSLSNLSKASPVAFTFTKPTDYTSYQLKGACAAIRKPRAKDWRRAREHFDAFLAEASRTGLEPSAFSPWFPADGRLLVACIDAVYSQAPGPRAGLAL
jgi:hypothetical protein